MSVPASESPSRRPADAQALARHQHRLAAAPQAPWLHGEVARRMAQRLPIIKLQPRRVLDWGASVGGGQAALGAAYPQALHSLVEPSPARRDATLHALRRPWWRLGGRAPAVLLPHEVAADSADLLWSNMGLHGMPDPGAEIAAWHRALAVGGFLMFSALGPGSLAELRALYRAAGWHAPMAPLVDMHDIGDLLVVAGFADPVMDQESITLTWPDAAACLTELRTIGGNAAIDRHPGLRTPRWRARLEAALAEQRSPNGRVALTFELVYGHAFRVAPRPRVTAQTSVPLDDLRRMVRAPRGSA